MSTAEDLERWDAVAETYASQIGQPEDSFFRRAQPAFDAAIEDPAGRRILDVGCGHGWLAAQYRARGAEVVGVDGSPALIDKARELDPAGQWLVHDLDHGLPDGIGTFDAAVAHMVLMDLPRLTPLLSDLHQALRPDAAFVFTLLHPAFFNQTVVEGPNGRWHRRVENYLDEDRWWIDSFGGHWHYHRPLECYVNELSAAGFSITAMTEPPTLPHDLSTPENWNAYQRWLSRIPTMMTLTARR